MPSITVLMTIYNGSRYLRPSLEAVLNQTFKDFEFLIVDDCSSDDSAAVVRSYSDPRIRLVCNEKNIGQTASLNKGLHLAHTPYVARMDADDLAFPQWLSRLAAFIEKHPEYAVVSAQAVVIDQNNKITKVLEACRRPEEILVKVLTHSPINHVGSLMNRQTILNEGGYDEKFKIAADFHLWCRLLKKDQRLTSIAETLLAIRFHASSISIRESKSVMFSELVDVIRLNFSQLSGVALDPQEATNVALLFYDLPSLKDEEYFQAKEILERGYQGLLSLPGYGAGEIKKYCELQLSKLDVKKIFLAIDAGSMDVVRKISLLHIRRRGVLNIFSGFWIISCFGRYGLKLVRGLYWTTNKGKAFLRTAQGENLNLTV